MASASLLALRCFGSRLRPLRLCGFGYRFAAALTLPSRLRGSRCAARRHHFGFAVLVSSATASGAVIFAAAVISVGAIWMLVVIGFGDAAVTVEVDVTIARDVFAIAARRLEPANCEAIANAVM